MAPPTFEELLTRTPLVPESDAYYKNFHVTDMAICGVEDDKGRQILVDPSASTVYFPNVKDVSPKTTFLNVDDTLYRRILTTEGGFFYERKAYRDDGAAVPLGMGVMHLCRSEKPVVNASGKIGYEVYISHNSIIDNQPSQPAVLRPVIFEFRPEEIMAIVHGLQTESGVAFRIPNDHYQVNPADHRQLSLMPNLKTLEAIIEGIQRKDSLIRPERREAMVNALKKFIQLEIQQDDAGKIPPWLLTVLGIVGGTAATIPVMVWMQKRNERLMREMQQGPKFDTKQMFTDATESMKQKDEVDIPESQRSYVEAIRSRFNQGGFPHIVLSGPSGSGKSYTADLIGRLAVNGQLGVGSFQNLGVRFVRIDVNEILRDAGSWQNGAQTRFFEILNQLTRENHGPVIIHLLEADKYAEAGQGPGNKPLNLLKELYTIMEGMNPQYRNVHFILDSTRWQTIREAAPDMLRRAEFMEIRPPFPEDVRRALVVGIDARRLRHKDDRIRERFERITFSPEALDAITAIGEFRDGAPPSSHLSIIDKIAEEADRHTNQKLSITREHVVRWIARETSRRVSDVNAELADRLGPDGVRKNPRIQAAIMEGFYRAYPEPMRGRINPLEQVVVAGGNPGSIFDDSAFGKSGSLADSLLNPTGMQAATSSPISSPVSDHLKDVFTDATFADQIRTYYPDLKNQKFDKIVDAMAGVARKNWLAALEASGSDHPPLTIVKNFALPREDFVEGELRNLVAFMEQRRHPQSLELKLVFEKGGVSPGRIDAYPTSLLEAGRKAFAAMPSALRVDVHSSSGVAAEPVRREDPYQSFLTASGLTENSSPQDIVVKLMGSGQYPNVLKDFLGLMHDPQFDAYSPEEQIELAHRLVRAHVGGGDAQKRPEWREIAESFHREVLAGKSEAEGRQEAVNRIEKSVEERRKEREKAERKSGRP